MPKEVKQKSGIIAGLNAGHSTFPRPPSTAAREQSTPDTTTPSNATNADGG
jgi:hypothetical protein